MIWMYALDITTEKEGVTIKYWNQIDPSIAKPKFDLMIVENHLNILNPSSINHCQACQVNLVLEPKCFWKK
jgi:hypothetical protein